MCMQLQIISLKQMHHAEAKVWTVFIGKVILSALQALCHQMKAGTSLAAERPQRLGPHAGKACCHACPARLLHQLPAQHC